MAETQTTAGASTGAATATPAASGVQNPENIQSMHTRTAGELRAENIGEEVTLTGWVWRRRDHGGLIFCDLRDRTGMTQCTFDPEHAQGSAFHTAETMRPEWPILVHGTVIARDAETVNPKLPTGEIEVLVDHIEVLGRSKTPPFQIEDGIETAEDTRLRYRYLDLRRPEMAEKLKLRSDFTFAIRSALHNRAFTEVETPALFKSTPEGARDFIVPSRLQPGSFYALPQSPQLLKQRPWRREGGLLGAWSPCGRMNACDACDVLLFSVAGPSVLLWHVGRPTVVYRMPFGLYHPARTINLIFA